MIWNRLYYDVMSGDDPKTITGSSRDENDYQMMAKSASGGNMYLQTPRSFMRPCLGAKTAWAKPRSLTLRKYDDWMPYHLIPVALHGITGCGGKRNLCVC